MSNEQQKIIFIYNAEAGFVNKLIDFTHKTFKPSTYPCSLCQLTYGSFLVKPEWANFIKSLNLNVSFLYKEELNNLDYELPIILLENVKGQVKVLINNTALESFKTLNELIFELKEKLKYSEN